MMMEPLFPIWALNAVVQAQVSDAWHRVFAVDLQTALQFKYVLAVEKVHQRMHTFKKQLSSADPT